MPFPIVPAKQALRQHSANWSRLFMRPIRLDDGAVLFTLKDAAERILNLPSVPSSRIAAELIIDAALWNGDMSSTRAAVRLALPREQKDRAVDRPPPTLPRRIRIIDLYPVLARP